LELSATRYEIPKADKSLIEILFKFIASAWATYKAWSKCGVNAWSTPMHYQHYQNLISRYCQN
jgi:hypothetical protein